MQLEDIIKEEYLNKPENNKLYNFSEESSTAKFYDDMYTLSSSEKDLKKTVPDLYNEVKEAHQKEGASYRIMEEIISLLESTLDENAVVLEIGASFYQQRSGNAYKRFKNYFPLDISYSSIKKYCDKFDKIGFAADAKKLPFKDNSIDCIFSHTFLEHPLEPEKVLNEISRVLKVGGIIVHNDAWFCRWWQKFGIVGLKKFKNMTLKEKFITICAKLSEISLIRIPPIIIKRFFKEMFLAKSKNSNLIYSKLEPNYELLLGCDEDAANSIDPMDVIRFYESRGFSTFYPLSLKERLFYPNKYIILKKMPS